MGERKERVSGWIFHKKELNRKDKKKPHCASNKVEKKIKNGYKKNEIWFIFEKSYRLYGRV